MGVSATGDADARAATGRPAADGAAAFKVLGFAAIGWGVLELLALDVAAAVGVGCEDFGASSDAGAGRDTTGGDTSVLSFARSRVSELTLATADLTGSGGSPPSRSSSGSMRSSVWS
jgi:hypothetical protein